MRSEKQKNRPPKDFGSKVAMYFDNSLPKKEEKRMMDAIRENPRYQSSFDKERLMRESLRSRVRRPEVSDGLIARIMRKIEE